MRKVLLLALLAGCGGAPEVIDVQVDEEGKEDSAKKISVSAGHDLTVRYKTTGSAAQVTIDCKPPANPDTEGMTFSVDAAELGTRTSDPDRAGFFRAEAALNAGNHELTVSGVSGSGSCSVSVQKLSGQCTDGAEWHSPNTGHTHIRVGTSARDWESFPASGNHWGAWAKWGQDYPRAIQRGFLLHNLEHGGIVLSYKCSSPTESADCKAAHAQLVELQQSFGENRVVITPDPTQPARFGVRAWRWAYSADCLDQTRALTFMDHHYKHGREDEDSDPPIPFDPTTTHVPCQDLMSAPDSCN
jgi:hypothetical protein